MAVRWLKTMKISIPSKTAKWWRCVYKQAATINGFNKGATVSICSHWSSNWRWSITLTRCDYLTQKQARLINKSPNRDCRGWISTFSQEVVLLENVRFNKGEKSNDVAITHYADHPSLWWMLWHRSSGAGIYEGVTQAMHQADKVACAGPLLAAELDALSRALETPAQLCWRLLAAKFLRSLRCCIA